MPKNAMRALLSCLLGIIFTLAFDGSQIDATANETIWAVEETDVDLKRAPRALAPNGLPDGHIATPDVVGDIAQAWYEDPTKRYRHAILGDDIEAASLVAKTVDGKIFRLQLPENEVFEDRTPRVLNLETGSKNQIATLLSNNRKGASIAIFGIEENQLRLIAQTPFIGRSNRWRNIAGVADFDGDGNLQIAEVVTPHIGGTLKFWTWVQGKVELSGKIYGFSNHFIGSREQDLSVADDFDDDGVTDLALPSANRRALRIIGFKGPANGEKQINEVATIDLPSQIDRRILSRTLNGKAEIIVGLSNGKTYRVFQR